MKAKEERMNKIKSATEQALHTLLGDDIFFTISDVAKVSKLSKSKIYEMKILPGQTNKTGGYRILFQYNKGGKLVCTRDELLKFIDYNGYVN